MRGAKVVLVPDLFWRRVAVNLRMADPKQVRDIPIKMFDGLTTMKPIVYSKECRVRDFGMTG